VLSRRILPVFWPCGFVFHSITTVARWNTSGYASVEDLIT
jgi:hypothetical protein